jgi:hypothetical protein
MAIIKLSANALSRIWIMKHVFGSFGGLALALACSSAVLGQAPPAPKLVLSREDWDFGAIWHPESPTLTLTVKNMGAAELKISGVRATCGCTQSDLGRKEVPPGESTEIKIRYNSEGKQDHVTSSVIIESNDPARPRIEFRISGIVKRAVRRDPLGGFVVRTLDPNAGQTATVRLENQTDEPMQIKLASCTVPGLDVEITAVTAGRVCEAVARTTKTMRHGVTRGEVVFSTGLQREAQVSVAVTIQVMTLVDPVPLIIYLDPKSAAQPGERTVNLNYYGTRDDFRVTGAVCEQIPNLKIAIGAPQPPPSGMGSLLPKMKCIVKTDLSLPAARDLPPGGLVILYTTNDPAYPTLEVPVTNERKVWEEAVNGPHGASRTPPR